jgi:hypothetical protein
MNAKILAILFLCMASFVCAQSAPSLGKSAPREHRGFYNSASFGFAYNWYDASKEDIDRYSDKVERGIDYFEYNGFTFPQMEFKFGVALGNLIAFHTVFNLGFFAGVIDYRYEEYNGVCSDDNVCIEVLDEKDADEFSAADAYSFRSFIGFGSTLYPFRDKESPLNGFFIGGSVGYTLFVTMINSNEEETCGNGGIGFQTEIGKDWWVNDHLSIGVGLGFAHNGLVWQTVRSHESDNVISISFRLTRG